MTVRFHPHKIARQAAFRRSQGNVDAAERLEAQLADAGCCRRCGRTLTDPLSVARGVGPECVKKVRL